MLSAMALASSASPSDIESLQREIWLAKVARGRQMTPEQRFAEMVALTSQAFERMHVAAMVDLGTADPDAGWAEVRRRLDRLRAARDAGRFTTSPPAAGPAVP